ncbi:ribitol 5-phosphate transferase FKRP-like [Eriocheir sinensis]|uniref:ribitol 5-phosphate transferase FKRP-like n=1 Tax=Eriocheir sinensis TaxID=95602 RepID=UPI0021C5A357|nr:ribitol 5-phosphate transferase FKRP-like [Eriocheir sinensis]
MVGVRKVRLLLVLVVLAVVLAMVRWVGPKHRLLARGGGGGGGGGVESSPPARQDPLAGLVVILREFEDYDNDVADTAASVLVACRGRCRVLVASDDLVYPPLRLPPGATSLVLTPSLMRRRPSLAEHLAGSRHVLLLPDGARLSSAAQLLDLLGLLEAGDTRGVAVGVGGAPLVCHRYTLDLPAWTLSVAPAPGSEACDAVAGRAALLLPAASLLELSLPLARPLPLALGVQGTARGWKVRVGRGGLLGEGRQLLATEHLRWKAAAAEEERRVALFKAVGLKKVVGPGGDVRWYGCSRTSPRCFPTVVQDTPDYLLRGRWTPPCCLEGLRATARHVFQTLRGCRVRWWLEGGSLLGAVRSGDLLPWDYDVDVGVYASDAERCPPLRAARWQTLEDTDGFVWQRAAEGGFYRVHYSTANHLHVDVFPFTARGGTMTRGGAWNTGHRQDVDFPEHFLRPIASVSFAGVMAAAPNNVRDFLELKFGPGVIETPQYPNPEVPLPANMTALLHR